MLGNIDDEDVVRIISIIVVVAWVALLILDKPIPELLISALGLVFGYYLNSLKHNLTGGKPLTKDVLNDR